MIHIQWTNTAFKELEVLPQDISFEIIRNVDLLANFPEMGSPLEANFSNIRELRQLIIRRKWRVVYDYDDFEKMIYIVAVQNCRQQLPSMRDLKRRKRETE